MCALLCYPALMPLCWELRSMHICSTSAASPAQLSWSWPCQQPKHCTPTQLLCSDFWAWICSASTCFLFYSDLLCYFFRNSFGHTGPCQSFTINTLFLNKFALEVIAITRQSPLLIYLLLSPMFNYSVQHKMSPGSDLKQNSNPSPILRYNFHGQQSFSSSERRNEKHRKSLPMKASSSSASACPPAQGKLSSPTETQSSFLRTLKMRFCCFVVLVFFFRKAWSTCCRQLTGRENEAPNLK